jgi:beta-glucosidase
VLICRVGDWTEPWDPEDPKDREACDRKIEFAICWFGDPVYFGKYPESMREQLGDRLPEFTADEAALVKGSNDFYGMNHYCANYIRHRDTEPELNDHAGNLDVLYQNKKGEWIGPETQSVWLRPMPLGFRKLIKWLSDRYGGPTFYVTENGTSLKGENDLPLEQLLDDEFRCEYFRGYIGALADAHTIDGVDVRGYSAWSLMEYVNTHPFLASQPPLSVRIDPRGRNHLSPRDDRVVFVGDVAHCTRRQIDQVSVPPAD